MKIGDFVRDMAGLGGIVEKIRPGIACKALVRWNSEDTGWINVKWLRVLSRQQSDVILEHKAAMPDCEHRWEEVTDTYEACPLCGATRPIVNPRPHHEDRFGGPRK